MKKKIYLEDGAKARLRQMFGCTNVMVWKALTFESTSKLARKIRYVALNELGGVPNWKVAEMETDHDQALGTMTQTFGDRVKLVTHWEDQTVQVLVDGEVTRSEQPKSIAAFMALQKEVQCMAMSL